MHGNDAMFEPGASASFKDTSPYLARSLNKAMSMDYTPYPAALGGDVTWNALESVKAKVSDRVALANRFNKIQVCVGVDGYVDSLYSLVSRRDGVENFEIMRSMSEFGKKVVDTAGSSCNVERVLKKHIGGGFGPNIARALGTLGARIDLIGCVGKPDDVFTSSLPSTINYHSLSEPGATCALEFNDGKVMLTDFGPVNNVTWDLIKKKIGRERLIDMFSKADAIGQGHWALVPHLNEIWAAWIDEVFPSLDAKERIFFVDPADMSKRSTTHLMAMMKQLEAINQVKGMKVILSLNDKEAIQLSRAFSHAGEIRRFEDYYLAGARMMETLNIHALVIHHPHFATISTKQSTWHVKEGYTTKPRFTTAAGDHFNGGALIALASGLFTPDEAMILANACTAYFVRTGISPDIEKLGTFIDKYRSYVDADLDAII
ncbi:MAG: carbohydrate kinase family protein [Candidatus Lokiarchaeota archaeon]|nr:carbohydrate kinase family protein [Candidatus Lokiarchaeota archaeon]